MHGEAKAPSFVVKTKEVPGKTVPGQGVTQSDAKTVGRDSFDVPKTPSSNNTAPGTGGIPKPR